MRCLALLTVMALAGAPQAANSIEILTAGEHHGDEVPANAPGAWFALVADAGGASLRRVRVTVAMVKDEIVDEGDAITGKRVDLSPPVEPIALVRGMRGLKPGRVPTLFVNKRVADVIDVRFGHHLYQFWTKCQEQPELVSGQRQETCDLIVRHGSVFQVLFTYGAYYEGGERVWVSEREPTILWAGDLNGDGLLDMLLDTSDHYNVSEMRLYLSRPGASDSLVQEVATYQTTGC